MTHRRGHEGDKPEVVRIWLLGGFRVSIGSRTVVGDRWRLRKAGSLIKLLALAQGHRLHREHVMELLWPDLGTKSAANNLHRVLHFARRVLEPVNTTSRYLVLRGDLLALCPDGPLWVDVEAFESAAAIAHRGREPTAYRSAIDLYAGELLPEDRYERWAEDRREELRRLYLALLVKLAALYEEQGKFDPAIEALQEAVANERTNEEAHLGLMRLYALSGQNRRALLQYRRLQKALSEDLDKEPDARSRHLHEEILAGQLPRARPQDHPLEEGTARHNLPNSRSSFVGRQREVVEVKRSLAMTQLLTLTGTGGSGKTRLALEVARDLVGTYPDGVWLVKLAPILDPALVPQAVAGTLGMREQTGRPIEGTLADHLRRERLLLVVDNCEHLVDAVAHLVDALLSACPKLCILATSREPLNIPGESVWPVRPLSLPDGDAASTVEGSMRSEAVRLFVDRARARVPDFELTEKNAGAVAEVCRELGGIPLAIELACARMGALAVDQVAERLDDSLRVLTGGGRTAEPRHRTMRAAIEWSHELLSEEERRLFQQLSVFTGGFSLEAAEAVCMGDEQDAVLDLLSDLVDKSLVVAEARSEGTVRYRTLEPIRQYARERLEGSGDQDAVRDLHAEYYLALAEGEGPEVAEFEVRGARTRDWLDQMETEQANLRAALFWLLDNGAGSERRTEMGARLATALWWFWHTHDYKNEGRRWLERAASKANGPSAIRLRARALSGAGWLAHSQWDYEASKALMEEALALYRELGDREGIAFGLTNLAWYAVLGERDDVPLPAILGELVELKPHVKNRTTIAYLLMLEGVAVGARGDLGGAVALHEESLRLLREIGDTQGEATCLNHLGLLELIRTDYEKALPLLRESLRWAWESDYKMFVLLSLYGLACVAASTGQPLRAARLWGAVEGMKETYDTRVTPITLSHTDYEGRLSTARSQLEDEKAFEEAWAEGKAISLERTIQYALSGEERSRSTALQQARIAGSPRILTRRQREIAVLVGRGLTNRRIAEELHLSEHTVTTHVREIRKNLGVHSRAQIATWITEEQHR